MSAGDRKLGVYPKYHKPERTDGKHLPGQKHADCGFFVLDIDHDPFAKPALEAYARACEATHPLLARDLLKAIGKGS